MAPAGANATFVETLYAASSNCSGTIKSTKTLTDKDSDTVGVGSSESLRLDASALTTSSPAGLAFFAWSSTDATPSPFTVIGGTGGKSICIAGFNSGTQNYRATYSAANTPPVANADAYSVNEDAVLTVAAPGVFTNDTDAQSNPLTVGVPRPATTTTNGVLVLNANGSFNYTPTFNFNGTDSFTYFANDGTVNSTTTATVTITVNAVDDAPTAVDDAATVLEDRGRHGGHVLTNDTDIDGGPKSIASVTQPTHGAVVITGGGTGLTYRDFVTSSHCQLCGPMTDGFTTPVRRSARTGHRNGDRHLRQRRAGRDQRLGDRSTRTAATPSAAPRLRLHRSQRQPAQRVRQRGHHDHPDSGSLKLSGVAVTAGQEIPVGSLGSLVFTPAADANGTPYASFTFQVRDNGTTTNGGVDLDQSANTFTLNVTAVNDAPVADDESISTTEDTAVNTAVGILLTGDTDVDSATLTVTGVSGATGGSAVLNNNGTPADKTDDFVTFTPAADLCGLAAGGYDYTVSDGSLSDTGRVTVDITCVDDTPTAVDDAATVLEDAAATAVTS